MERYPIVNLVAKSKVYKKLNYKHYRCLLCHRSTSNKFALCHKCSNNLPFNTNSCSICSKPLIKSSICGDCSLLKNPYIDRVISVFLYKYPINHLLVGLKFNQHLIAGSILGQLMVSKLSELIESRKRIDCVVPVPLFYQRLLSRGYNQSICLAKPICDELDLPLNLKLCSRNTNTKNQTSLNAQQRRLNVLNAFEVNSNVEGKNIVLVDDVITTGSTLRELAKKFKSAGAANVEAWCCAIRID